MGVEHTAGRSIRLSRGCGIRCAQLYPHRARGAALRGLTRCGNPDTIECVEAFLPLIDAAISEGLATIERVYVRFYRSGTLDPE